MNGVFRTISRALCLNLVLTTYSLAGPPFLTDDPEPVDLRHWEAYLFTSGMTCSGGYDFEGPAVELNYGVLPNTQLHLIVPLTSVDGPGTPARLRPGGHGTGHQVSFCARNERTSANRNLSNG